MSEDLVIVDEELIHKATPSHSGWYREQIRILGLTFPLQAGWKQRILGIRIPRSDAERLVAIKVDAEAEQRLLFRR